MVGFKPRPNRPPLHGGMRLAAPWVASGLLVLIAWFGAAEPVRPYLITDRALYRVENGGLSRVRLLVTAKQRVIQIRAYQNEGHVFILSAREQRKEHALFLEVVDLSSVTTEMSHDMDLCEGCRHAASGLIVRNDQLIYMVEATRSVGDTVVGHYYAGVNIATGLAVDNLDARDIERTHAFGDAPGLSWRGASENRTSELGIGEIYSDGLLPYRVRVINEGWTRFDLDYALPRELACRDCRIHQKIHTESVRLLASDRSHAGPMIPANTALYVLNKKRGEWRRLAFETCHSSTAFGNWLVVGESYWSPWTKDCYGQMARGFGGVKLHFFNTLTGEEFMHDIARPGGRVLMIDDDGVVYLRMVDELWRGRIVDGRLDDGRLNDMELIARSTMVPRVRWMVFGDE